MWLRGSNRTLDHPFFLLKVNFHFADADAGTDFLYNLASAGPSLTFIELAPRTPEDGGHNEAVRIMHKLYLARETTCFILLSISVLLLISSYEKITTVTHKQLFIKVHVHAQKSPWTNHWQPLDCGLIIRWSCFKLPLYFPIILDVTHKLFWLLSVVNMNFVLFPTSFDTHIFKCWLPQYL